MDDSSSADKTPGGSVRVAADRATPPATIDLTSLTAVLDASIREAIAAATAPIHEQIGALKERADIVDAIKESRRATDESGDDGVGDDSSSSSSADSLESLVSDTEHYISVSPTTNPHFGAGDIAHQREFKPHRHQRLSYAVLTCVMLLVAIPVVGSACSDGTVSSYQKISDTVGDFTAPFENGDEFGNAIAQIGDLNNDGGARSSPQLCRRTRTHLG